MKNTIRRLTGAKFFKDLIENKKLLAVISVSVVLVVMFLTAFFSSRGIFGDPGDSAIVDEVAHIPAGYTYIKDLDYRLNPEHPPIAKALSGVSMVLAGIKGPENDWSWNDVDHLNGAQWNAGWYMIYHAGNNPERLLIWARLPIILLMIGLGLLLYKWAAEKFGRKVGLIVLILYALYPDVLAHGRLVTTDIAAAFGYVVAVYFFDKVIEKKTWKYILFAAAAFALAQALKFSAFLLFFVFLVLILVRAILDRKDSSFLRELWKNFKIYFWVCLISVIFVWIIYLPFTWRTPSHVEHQLIEANLTSDPRTLPLRNFLHLFENNPIARALGHYFIGIMLVIARVQGGNNTFIMGHLSDKSISWFFPVAWLLKTPITIIILFVTTVISLALSWPKEKAEKWFLALVLTPFLTYWGFTLKGQLDIGIRHLMPTVPFVLMLIGYLAYRLFQSEKRRTYEIVILVLIAYMAVSTYSNFPNFISYFNEFTPKDIRYTRLIDSSLDWGQDLLRLKQYVEKNHISDLKIDYFGGSAPSEYLPDAQPWHAEYGPTTGHIAISATFYQSSKLVGKKEGKWSYDWLDRYKPKAVIGGSILVFDITPQDLINNPPRSPYAIKRIEYPNINQQ